MRKLLDELAIAEQQHEDLAAGLRENLEESGARESEDDSAKRMFVLQVIQPGLAAIDGRFGLDPGTRFRCGVRDGE